MDSDTAYGLKIENINKYKLIDCLTLHLIFLIRHDEGYMFFAMLLSEQYYAAVNGGALLGQTAIPVLLTSTEVPSELSMLLLSG